MRSSKAPNTDKAYAFAWGVFASWCDAVGHCALPAAERTVCDFVLWCLYERQPRPYRVASVYLALTAISQKHREAQIESPITRDVFRLLRKRETRPARVSRGKSCVHAFAAAAR